MGGEKLLVGSAVGCDDNSPPATTTLVDSSLTALSTRADLAGLAGLTGLAGLAASDNNSYSYCHTLLLEISKKS